MSKKHNVKLSQRHSKKDAPRQPKHYHRGSKPTLTVVSAEAVGVKAKDIIPNG